jgi:hypothetical protein
MKHNPLVDAAGRMACQLPPRERTAFAVALLATTAKECEGWLTREKGFVFTGDDVEDAIAFIRAVVKHSASIEA